MATKNKVYAVPATIALGLQTARPEVIRLFMKQTDDPTLQTLTDLIADLIEDKIEARKQVAEASRCISTAINESRAVISQLESALENLEKIDVDDAGEGE